MQKHLMSAAPSSVRICSSLIGGGGEKWGGWSGECLPQGKHALLLGRWKEGRELFCPSDSQFPSLKIILMPKWHVFGVAYLVPVMRLIVGLFNRCQIPSHFNCHFLSPHSFLLTSFSLGSDNFLNVLVWFPSFSVVWFFWHWILPFLPTCASTNELDFLFLNWICWAWYLISGHAWPSGCLYQWHTLPTFAAVIQYRLQSQGPRVHHLKHLHLWYYHLMSLCWKHVEILENYLTCIISLCHQHQFFFLINSFQPIKLCSVLSYFFIISYVNTLSNFLPVFLTLDSSLLF